MPDSIRAHLRAQFQRRLHPEITQDGDALIVKIEADRLRLHPNKKVEAQRQHPCCKFEGEHLVMRGEGQHVRACIDFIAASEEDVWANAHSAHDGRRRVPKSAVR